MYRAYRPGRLSRYARNLRTVVGAVGAARSAYRLGRSLYNAYKGKRRTRQRAVRRGKAKRYPKSFLKSIGMTQNKLVTHVSRGSCSVSYASNSSIKTLCSISLNNCNLPIPSALAGGAAAWDTRNPTGYQHMYAMYRKYTVLGAKLNIVIRRDCHYNLAQTTSGTSTYSVRDSPVMKFGIHATESTLAGDSLDSWPKIQMLGERVKSHAWQWEQNRDSVRLNLKWSMKKHLSSSGDVSAYKDYTAQGGVNPTTEVYAIVWEQVADLISTPLTAGQYEISWTLSQFTKWSDFIGAENDMIPVAPS